MLPNTQITTTSGEINIFELERFLMLTHRNRVNRMESNTLSYHLKAFLYVKILMPYEASKIENHFHFSHFLFMNKKKQKKNKKMFHFDWLT